MKSPAARASSAHFTLRRKDKGRGSGGRLTVGSATAPGFERELGRRGGHEVAKKTRAFATPPLSEGMHAEFCALAAAAPVAPIRQVGVTVVFWRNTHAALLPLTVQFSQKTAVTRSSPRGFASSAQAVFFCRLVSNGSRTGTTALAWLAGPSGRTRVPRRCQISTGTTRVAAFVSMVSRIE